MDATASLGPGQQPALQGWQAPSAIERGLYEARVRGDWPAYYDLVAQADLYVVQSRTLSDAEPDTFYWHPTWNPGTRSDCLAVYTAGMLPAPVPDPVFDTCDLGWLAERWGPTKPPYLVVNPGSPCEGVIPASPEGLALWRWHHDARGQRTHGLAQYAVHTLEVGGPRQGQVAFGLGVGAQLFVQNGQFWNSLANHGGGYVKEKKALDRWWGITDRAEWLDALERLLRADMVSSVWEFVLQLRHAMARDFAGPVSTDHWREAAERVIRARAEEAAQPRLMPDGVTQGRVTSTATLESEVAGVQRLIGRITRYEARFRADGLLAEGAYIRSVDAWDYGRASAMARWGVATRLGSVAEAESAVIRAGRLVQVNYRSWADFSASYALGRCLQFDEEEFGDWYEESLRTHRVLMTDPTSPWLTIPWA
ncbi:DUF1266 domain-containing protein [Streptomyces sp. CC208A]|uniref:DUF1266 domain-containing protein n=1 Tax=Streptomyces sp. CC208A TaxID=3044573 RepID=UPI0024A87956|nr:DUF1266 domain-containing protein [Streptomyces sp. CC208A]